MKDMLFQVDAFTEKPFKGNPAAVCLLQKARSDTWMRQFAAEMNLSETAYLVQNGDVWGLRWFTPTTEVDLCGHATLASAKVLFDLHHELRPSPLTFQTKSGALSARWADGAIELDFPAMPPRMMSIGGDIEQALGLSLVRGAFVGSFSLLEAEDPREVINVQPDFALVSQLPLPEIILTAKSADPAYDFISRFFAPKLGIDEDPVTGSAHCVLAPYWAKRLGKTQLTAYQASRRGGVLHLTLREDRVLIRGDARIIFSGELWI